MVAFLGTLTEAANKLNQLNPTETDVTLFVTEI